MKTSYHIINVSVGNIHIFYSNKDFYVTLIQDVYPAVSLDNVFIAYQ